MANPRSAVLHLYLAEVLGVGTKVGVSTNPSVRLADLQRLARDFGRELGRTWVSIRHVEARANELALVGWREPEVLRKPFDEVLSAITTLPMTPVGAATSSAGFFTSLSRQAQGTP